MSLHARRSHAGLRTLLPALLLSLLAFASADARQPGASATAASAPINNQTAPQGATGGAGAQAAGTNTAGTNTTAGAQTAVGPTAGGASGAGAAPARKTDVPDLSTVVRVTKVYNQRYVEAVRRERAAEGQNGSGDANRKDPRQAEPEDMPGAREAGLNDIIIIDVKNLEALLRRAACEAPYDQTPCEPHSISLYINGREIKGLQPESGAPTFVDPPAQQPGTAEQATQPQQTVAPCGLTVDKPVNCRDGSLRYHLQRVATPGFDEDNQEHWADLLGIRSTNPLRWFKDWRRPAEVSVGLSGAYPLRTNVRHGALDQQFYLVSVRPWRIPFWLLVTIGIIALLVWLARRHDILCDRTPVVWPARRPYSLSAVQAAWWFLIIVIIFIAIWLVTGEYDISDTALILLGIGLGTALGSTVIDSNKRSPDAETGGSQEELNTLIDEKRRLEDDLKALRKQGKREGDPDFDAKLGQYKQNIDRIKERFPSAIGPGREKFILDILSDAGGVSFPRFQMLVWTLVLGIFFIVSALSKLAMPDFSATLLGLMGLSAGTYLGFKIPEKAGGGAEVPSGGGGGGGNGGNGPGGGGVNPDPAAANQAQANAAAAAAAEKAAADAAAAAARTPTITPESGPSEGVTPVAIANTGLADVKSVTFDGTDATEVMFDNATSTINAITPPHPPGTAEVMVTDQAGTSVVLSYTYNDESEDERLGEEG